MPKAMKFHAAILSNGDVDIGDINLADMDPEDIRVCWCLKLHSVNV